MPFSTSNISTNRNNVLTYKDYHVLWRKLLSPERVLPPKQPSILGSCRDMDVKASCSSTSIIYRVDELHD